MSLGFLECVSIDTTQPLVILVVVREFVVVVATLLGAFRCEFTCRLSSPTMLLEMVVLVASLPTYCCICVAPALHSCGDSTDGGRPRRHQAIRSIAEFIPH